MYLRNPVPLPVNSNPGMVFPRRPGDGPRDGPRDTVDHAARFIRRLLDYKEILDRRELPLERATCREKGQPLCMDQYYRVFTTYRIPGRDLDVQRSTFTDEPPESEHIIVASRNQFFSLNVKIGGEKAGIEGISEALMRIIRESQEDPDPDPPVGILTTRSRPEWAADREKLIPENEEALELIETCLFVVCFDAIPPGIRDDVNAAEQMLHGSGSTVNSGNRWFDKTAQFVFTSDGVWGLCYEHSAAEGIAVVNVLEDTIAALEDGYRPSDGWNSDSPRFLPPQRIRWRLHDDLKKAIEIASLEMDRSVQRRVPLVSNTDVKIFRYEGYGKEFAKQQKTSPDAFIQLALQLAYYRLVYEVNISCSRVQMCQCCVLDRLHGHLVFTYESASTRRFRYGRVDNIRASTWEALEFAKSMQPDSTFSVRISLFFPLDEIIDPRDRHSFSHRGKTCIPSQIPTKMESFMLYGPVVEDGYGTSYNPRPNDIVFCISSFKSCSKTSSERFQCALKDALDDIRLLLGSD
ncbi:unnamed protein product [Darwinula stevensoni]|uniref:Choline O-acetyltransferase n=1 Tax=Darwinula stevensoni TaxID=69355 RepID=A0A7R8X7W2_9CRUS|nr:unnamed protein product [Darwinula stevensoni]CAG0883780.1 unnamed protein product [Darwinula stevensoni]